MNKKITGVPDFRSNEARDQAIEARQSFRNSISDLKSTKAKYHQLKQQYTEERKAMLEEARIEKMFKFGKMTKKHPFVPSFHALDDGFRKEAIVNIETPFMDDRDRTRLIQPNRAFEKRTGPVNWENISRIGAKFNYVTGQEDVVYDHDMLKYMNTLGRGVQKPQSMLKSSYPSVYENLQVANTNVGDNSVKTIDVASTKRYLSRLSTQNEQPNQTFVSYPSQLTNKKSDVTVQAFDIRDQRRNNKLSQSVAIHKNERTARNTGVGHTRLGLSVDLSSTGMKTTVISPKNEEFSRCTIYGDSEMTNRKGGYMAVSRYYWNPQTTNGNSLAQYEPRKSVERLNTPRTVQKMMSLERTQNKDVWMYNRKSSCSFSKGDIKPDLAKGKLLKKLKRRQRRHARNKNLSVQLTSTQQSQAQSFGAAGSPNQASNVFTNLIDS